METPEGEKKAYIYSTSVEHEGSPLPALILTTCYTQTRIMADKSGFEGNKPCDGLNDTVLAMSWTVLVCGIDLTSESIEIQTVRIEKFTRAPMESLPWLFPPARLSIHPPSSAEKPSNVPSLTPLIKLCNALQVDLNIVPFSES